MNKKGVSTLVITIGVLLISIASASTLFAFGAEAAKGRILDSRILAKDLELTLNAVCLDQNNIHVIYDLNKDNYIATIDNGIITIKTQADNKLLLRETFSPKFCKDFDSSFLEYGSDEAIISKSENKVFLENDFTHSEEKVDLTKDNADFMWPSESKLITSCYGFRNVEYGSRFHEGIDIRSDIGQNVFSIADGSVIVVDKSSGTLGIDHGKGIISKYLHLEKILVEKGVAVKKGEKIAVSGEKNTLEPHLDFRIAINGKYIDPLTSGMYKPSDFDYKTSDVKKYDSNCHYDIDKYSYEEDIKNNLAGD